MTDAQNVPEQLASLRSGQESLRSGQAEILRQLKEMNGTIRETVIEIGGVPGLGRDTDRRSMRRRLHDLENDRTTAQVAATAVNAAQQLRAAAGDKRFTRREKWTGIILAAIVAAGPYIALLLHH